MAVCISVVGGSGIVSAFFFPACCCLLGEFLDSPNIGRWSVPPCLILMLVLSLLLLFVPVLVALLVLLLALTKVRE